MLQVLAIDDSLTIRSILTETLQQAGFEVTTAVDGVDGLTKYQAKQADVVITDINMPELDGFGVIDGIRKGDKKPTVPIMVLSTESAPELKDRARRAGASGWIVKPFSEESLIAALKRVTGV